jgi:hypothetical protein
LEELFMTKTFMKKIVHAPLGARHFFGNFNRSVLKWILIGQFKSCQFQQKRWSFNVVTVQKMVMFRKRSKPIDWKAIASGRSVDAVMRDPSDQSINEIQSSLENITFGKIKSKAVPEMEVLVKGFEYAQLTIEYLLNVQESLSSALSLSQRELEEERIRIDELERKEKKSKSNAKKLKECQATLQAASYMLTQFGVETTPLQKMCEDGLRGAKAPEYVWVPAFLDPYDGKAFQSAEFLKKHMFSKNVESVKSDLNSGKYSAPTDYDLTMAMSKSAEVPPVEEAKIPQPRDEIEGVT